MERGSGRAASTVATHRGAAGKGATVKKAIADLPNLRRFLDTEGGLVRWHADFKTA